MRRLISWVGCGLIASAFVAVPHPASARELPASDQIQSITPQEVMALIVHGGGPLVIDVRPPAQYEQGHVPGARSVYSKWIWGRLPELEPYRERGIVIYCKSGLNSKRAAIKLLGEGYRKVFVMQGYLPAWTRLGYPLEVSPAE